MNEARQGATPLTILWRAHRSTDLLGASLSQYRCVPSSETQSHTGANGSCDRDRYNKGSSALLSPCYRLVMMSKVTCVDVVLSIPL